MSELYCSHSISRVIKRGPFTVRGTQSMSGELKDVRWQASFRSARPSLTLGIPLPCLQGQAWQPFCKIEDCGSCSALLHWGRQLNQCCPQYYSVQATCVSCKMSLSHTKIVKRSEINLYSIFYLAQHIQGIIQHIWSTVLINIFHIVLYRLWNSVCVSHWTAHTKFRPTTFQASIAPWLAVTF